MDLNLKKYIAFFLVFLSLIAILHYMLFLAFPDFIGISLKTLAEIYSFLLILNLAHFLGIKWLFIKWAKYAGFLFTGMSLVKMAVSILFLMPYIFPSTTQSIPAVLNFMGVYFLALTFEVIFIAKNMTKI
jgi:hypothetical protein